MIMQAQRHEDAMMKNKVGKCLNSSKSMSNIIQFDFFINIVEWVILKVILPKLENSHQINKQKLLRNALGYQKRTAKEIPIKDWTFFIQNPKTHYL